MADSRWVDEWVHPFCESESDCNGKCYLRESEKRHSNNSWVGAQGEDVDSRWCETANDEHDADGGVNRAEEDDQRTNNQLYTRFDGR